MLLMELLETYPEASLLKEKFPKLYDYAYFVKVLDWQEEYAVADKNPEVIDEIEFWQMLLESGLISKEEYEKKLSSLPRYASRTEGIAFRDTNEVSFRKKRPPFHVIVHELGHCYFKEPDPTWNSTYGGGEWLLWIVLRHNLKGFTEEHIKNYMQLLKLNFENPQRLYEILTEKSLEVAKKFGIDNVKTLEELCMYCGWIPPQGDKTLFNQSFLVNVLSSIEYRDFLLLWLEILRSLTTSGFPSLT